MDDIVAEEYLHIVKWEGEGLLPEVGTAALLCKSPPLSVFFSLRLSTR